MSDGTIIAIFLYALAAAGLGYLIGYFLADIRATNSRVEKLRRELEKRQREDNLWVYFEAKDKENDK